MELGQKLTLMQNTYAAAIAETVNTYARLKVLDHVVEKKKEGQARTAPYMNAQLGVRSPEEVFLKLADTFGCANWTVEKTADGYAATATACKLCALCKKLGGADPCRGWCLDPMTAMIQAVAGGQAVVSVQSTLMEGDRCEVLITTPAK